MEFLRFALQPLSPHKTSLFLLIKKLSIDKQNKKLNSPANFSSLIHFENHFQLFPWITNQWLVFEERIANSSALARTTSNGSLEEGISGRRGGEVQTKHRRRDIQHRASVYRHEAASAERRLSSVDELAYKTRAVPRGPVERPHWRNDESHK